MAERPDCSRMDQLIPELAIGVAAGDDRARVLGHLARCVPCRSVLESASAAADAVLLIAPVREPPPGFETRVLAGLSHSGHSGQGNHVGQVGQAGEPQPAPRWTRRETYRRPRHRATPSRPAPTPVPTPAPRPQAPRTPWTPRTPRPGAPRTARWRRRLLRLATTVTIAGLVGGALWWRTDDDRHLAAGYRATLAIAHGQYMRAAPLVTQSVAHAGYIVAYEGEPSWVLMVVRTGDVSGDYDVRLVTRDGRSISLGTMSIAHGQGTWGATIPTSVDQIAAVTITRPSALAITGRLG